MPAMPKEKTSPIPLAECNFVEMKMKEQFVGSTSSSSTATTASTIPGHHHYHHNNHQQTGAKLIVSTKMPENKLPNSDGKIGGCNCNNTLIQQNQEQQQQQQQLQQHQQKSIQAKYYTSSYNDIYSTNTSLRTPSSILNETGQITRTTNDILNTPTTISSLLNGSTISTTNLFNVKNDINSILIKNSSILNNRSPINNKYCFGNNSVTTTCNGISTIQQQQQQQQQQKQQQPSAPVSLVASSLSTNSLTQTSNTRQILSSSLSSKSAMQQNSNQIISSSPSSSPSTSPPSTSSAPTTAPPRGNISGGQSNTTASSGIIPPKKSAKDYVFGKIIGEGSFSTVCLARDIHTNREYAIKICYKPHILREKKQEYVRREREVMHIMNNVPGFVNLSCTFQDYRNLYFVMTLAKNGDLLPYINKVGSFDLDCTRHYAAELVLAIENMHKRGVIHRDLKPENILLDENMHTLIADFGSAKIFDVNQEINKTSITMSDELTTAENEFKQDKDKLPSSSSSSLSTSTSTTYSPANKIAIKSSTLPVSSRRINQNSDDDDNEQQNDDDDDDSPKPIRRRRGSFVGTAQYVSPEVLQGEIVGRSADLWALGCIIYQMISGLPPFRGGSDYLIFKEIMNLHLVFPEGFDKDAENLVRNLLKIKPNERLGASNPVDQYNSIRSHPFFNTIDWDKIRQIQPPQIYPYLPGVSKDEELRSHYRVPDNLQPGLDDIQLTRLLGLELGTIGGIDIRTSSTTTVSSSSSSSSSTATIFDKKTEPKNNLNISESEKQKRLEIQQKTDKWHTFSDGELILKKGFINKRKGLFARKRMLLLTTGPRLIYIDPVHMVKKGEIPWSSQLRVEPKNFKIFFVHTPNRTYYLEDPEGYALDWVNTIEDVRQKTYGDKT